MRTSPLIFFCSLCVVATFVNANNDYPKSVVVEDLLKNQNMKHVVGPKLINKLIKKEKHADKEQITDVIGNDIRNEIRHDINREYTAFPDLRQIPSSLYFRRDVVNDEPKLRVKKILPDFWNAHYRKKRSSDNDTNDNTDGKDNKEIELADAKAVNETQNNKGKTIVESMKNDNGTVKKPASSARSSKLKARSSKKTNRSKKTGKKNKMARSKPKGKANKAARSKTAAKRSSSKRGGKKQNKEEIESRRLIAARDATIESYPYVVSIQKDGEHWCAGALLNQRLVITTANCVWKSTRISRMKIRACSRHVTHGGQSLKIAEVLKHPYWSIRSEPDNDIALLLTKGFIKFSHTCHAVDLPNRVMMPLFDDAWVASWGAERRDGIYVSHGLTMQVYHARLMNRESCNNVTMRFGIEVTENFICLEQIGRRAPCTRDTGAPAVSDGVLWGLASWGIRKLCGSERFPAMFSYIASEHNMDFIINGTKYLMSEERLSPFLDRYPFVRDQGLPKN